MSPAVLKEIILSPRCSGFKFNVKHTLWQQNQIKFELINGKYQKVSFCKEKFQCSKKYQFLRKDTLNFDWTSFKFVAIYSYELKLISVNDQVRSPSILYRCCWNRSRTSSHEKIFRIRFVRWFIIPMLSVSHHTAAHCLFIVHVSFICELHNLIII